MGPAAQDRHSRSQTEQPVPGKCRNFGNFSQGFHAPGREESPVGIQSIRQSGGAIRQSIGQSIGQSPWPIRQSIGQSQGPIRQSIGQSIGQSQWTIRQSIGQSDCPVALPHCPIRLPIRDWAIRVRDCPMRLPNRHWAFERSDWAIGLPNHEWAMGKVDWAIGLRNPIGQWDGSIGQCIRQSIGHSAP